MSFCTFCGVELPEQTGKRGRPSFTCEKCSKESNYRTVIGDESDPNREIWMVALYKSGKTLQQIGEIYGVSRERIRQLIKKWGITRLDGGVHLKCTPILIEAEISRQKARNDKCMRVYGCDVDEFKRLNLGLLRSDIRSPAALFASQRNNAKRRGIAWEMTFLQWITIWNESGKWEQRGLGIGKYCMARKMDTGGYTPGNIHIITCDENTRDYQASLKDRGIEASDGIKRLPESDALLIQMPRKMNKEFCLYGHARTPENLYPSGGCKTCQKARSQVSHEKRRSMK